MELEDLDATEKNLFGTLWPQIRYKIKENYWDDLKLTLLTVATSVQIVAMKPIVFFTFCVIFSYQSCKCHKKSCVLGIEACEHRGILNWVVYYIFSQITFQLATGFGLVGWQAGNCHK